MFSSLFQVFECQQLLVQNPKMRFKIILVAVKIGLLINLLSLCTTLDLYIRYLMKEKYSLQI